MKLWPILMAVLMLAAAPAGADEGGRPAGLREEMLSVPGIHALADGRLAAVGQGRVTTQLGQARAERLARSLAESDAKKRLARHLFPDEIKKHGRVSLSIKGARVIDTRPGRTPDLRLVTLLVDPALVTPLPYDPTEDFDEYRASPLLGELLRQSPALAGGGGRVFERDGGWLALGIGYADRPAEGEEEREARVVARVAATEALNKAVFGSTFTVDSTSREVRASGPGGDRLLEWYKNTSREEAEGRLAQVRIIGEWRTDQGLGLAVATGVPDPEAGLDQVPAPAPELALNSLEIEAPWRDGLARRPWLWSGGTGLSRTPDGRLWLLAVEGGALKNEPVHDQTQLPTLIETKVRGQVVRFLSGLAANSRTIDTEEFSDLGDQAEITRTLKKAARENAAGLAAGLRRVGQWRSDDGRTLYQAFAVPLESR